MVANVEETEVRASTEAAQNFIDYFYVAINERRSIAHFYVNSNAKYTTAGTRADISINGRLCATPADFESLLEKQSTSGTGKVHYEVDGFDVHVLNPAFRVACPEHLLPPASGSEPPRSRVAAAMQAQKASLLLQVTGTVQYGSGKEALRNAFTDVFVLVPNWDAIGPRAPRNLRNWLIMSQNFRGL